MSTARTQKEEIAQQLRDELSGVPHAILVDFRGLNVAGATDLRRKLRDGEASFRVVKNSTVLRAIEDMPLAELSDAFVGQTAIAYTDGDIVNLAKVLTEFEKDFETPTFKAGIVDGAPISAEEFVQLSQLPPRQELVGKLVYLMAYPMTGLATALNGILRGFVVALEQIRQQKEEAGEAEPEAAEAAAEEQAGEAEAATETEEAPAPEAEAAADAEPTEAAVSEEPAEEAEAPADEEPAEQAAAPEEPTEEAEAPADEEPEKAEAAAEESSDEAEEAAGDDDAAAAEEEDKE